MSLIAAKFLPHVLIEARHNTDFLCVWTCKIRSQRAKNSFLRSYNKLKVGLWTSLPVHHYNM